MEKKIASLEISGLDAFDRRILDLVQRDNQMTHADIGDAVGLSSSAVRRRLKAMRDVGIIDRDVAILRSEGIGIRLVVTLSFQNESIETYEAFDKQMREAPEVLQAYHVSGPMDYVLIIQGPSVQWYEEWGKRTLMNNPFIRRYDSHVVWSCKKFETAVKL